jgi:adenine-specific DNA-methyltransferase
MNYIGSKIKLSSWIKDEISGRVENLSDKVFADLFAGTGAIGQVFKKDVKQVISNDLEYYSFVLNRNYIENHIEIRDKQNYIDELNNLPLKEDGFIYQNYCYGSGSERLYFSDHNGKKIDTIRVKIEEWFKNNRIDDDTYYLLLTSLLESADKVANTASVYGAFLKKLKASALKPLILKSADFQITPNSHKVYNKDSNLLIKEIRGDILYLDPPYNNRQYSSNYHILNTIAKYQRFTPKGKTGLPDYNRSKYSQKGEVLKAFEELIKNADFKFIFLSYNNEGIMSSDDVKTIMSKYGEYDLAKQKYQRFKADSNREQKANHTFEYLHILEKSKFFF